jgi:hypothetical protein
LGESTGEEHDLVVTLLQRVYTIAAMEGSRGLYRRHLADLTVPVASLAGD